VIDASTLSQNRRRFNDSEIYQQIFDNIVEPSQYVDALNQAINEERELNGKKP
jgi:hypothetical protein